MVPQAPRAKPLARTKRKSWHARTTEWHAYRAGATMRRSRPNKKAAQCAAFLLERGGGEEPEKIAYQSDFK